MTGSKWTSADMPNLDGKTFVVTGANSGIGLAAVRELAQKGATVVLACRSVEKGAAAADEIRPSAPRATLDVMSLDLADLSSVRAFAEAFTRAHRRLDVLVNNAGVMALPRSTTVDGFEMQLGTNHLGHFALTGLLLDSLKRRPGSRVVTVSSNAHKMGRIDFDDLQGETEYRRWDAYGQSKLANLVFALELQRRIETAGLNIRSVGAHPGYTATNLTTAGNSLEGGGLLSRFSAPVMWAADRVLAQGVDAGALPILYAATVEDLPGGSYVGPDGWREFRGGPKVVRPRRLARDPEVAKRLWQVSEDLTGVEYDFGVAAKPA
jgi:NAD(P)-dependent dehydrogenase (short-subunit alcohol dehydrogenase family)